MVSKLVELQFCFHVIIIILHSEFVLKLLIGEVNHVELSAVVTSCRQGDQPKLGGQMGNMVARRSWVQIPQEPLYVIAQYSLRLHGFSGLCGKTVGDSKLTIVVHFNVTGSNPITNLTWMDGWMNGCLQKKKNLTVKCKVAQRSRHL